VSSRLTVRRKQNRRRPESLWSRVTMPDRHAVLDACGRALRRSYPALVATLVIAALGGGIVLGVRFVTTSERFAIAEITIEGPTAARQDELRTRLPVAVGENIFTTDLADVTAALRRDPWVISASAHRVLPDTLVIEVRERSATAVVQLGDEFYLVDNTGHPFKRAHVDADEGRQLPMVTGLDRDRYRHAPDETAALVLHALEVLAHWRTAARPEIGEIHVDAHHAITLRTYEQGAAIELGQLGPLAPTRGLDDRFATFDAAWVELTDHERARVSTVHLDARSDHATVAFKD
jgi:cell division protein FtsQ